MNRFSRFRNPALVAIGAALGALAVIGFSVVSATGADAQIHACLKTSNGSLSILAAGDICPKGSTQLDWNIQGPQGEPGPEGPAGPAGPSLTSLEQVNGLACTVQSVAGVTSAVVADDGTVSIHCTASQDGDGDGYVIPADCDDSNTAIHPGAAEVANALDDNCNGTIDEGLSPVMTVVSPGGTSSSVSYQVTNTGTAPATTVQVVITGAYQLAQNGCSSLEIGASCDITVSWSPDAPPITPGVLTVTGIYSVTHASNSISISLPATLPPRH